jgi:hypothetical protein
VEHQASFTVNARFVQHVTTGVASWMTWWKEMRVVLLVSLLLLVLICSASEKKGPSNPRPQAPKPAPRVQPPKAPRAPKPVRVKAPKAPRAPKPVRVKTPKALKVRTPKVHKPAKPKQPKSPKTKAPRKKKTKKSRVKPTKKQTKKPRKPKTSRKPASAKPKKTKPAKSSEFNIFGKPHITHAIHCIRFNKEIVPLYTADGKPIMKVDGNPLVYISKPNPRCNGRVEASIQGMEVVKANGKKYYYVWGLGVDANTFSGHVAANDLAKKPAIKPSSRRCTENECNGRYAPIKRGVVYSIQPVDIPHDLYYFAPRTKVYHPVYRYGQPDNLGTNVIARDLTIMSWSWINQAGGGIARAMIPRGGAFHPANVEPITTNTFDKSGNENGSITAMYGYYHNGSQRLYGWVVSSVTDTSGNVLTQLVLVK